MSVGWIFGWLASCLVAWLANLLGWLVGVAGMLVCCLRDVELEEELPEVPRNMGGWGGYERNWKVNLEKKTRYREKI